MTLKAYIDDLRQAGGQSLVDTMLGIAELWSNNACRGYFISAARAAGLDQDTIRTVLDELGAAFDSTTVDEAERDYINY